ncbi:hypothetical protein EDD15DRAFT_767478 [Pisolithus albus]|nr:hypothetical protein EDD15DRAFT_767478 [Pisolithus albus]
MIPSAQTDSSTPAASSAGSMASSTLRQGLMVVVQYNPRRFEGRETEDVINAVLDDLGRLRVHLPSRKNVRHRGNRWIALHWPMSRMDASFNKTNSLYSRWVKLSRGEESQQLLKNLLIDSILVVDGGRMISSSAFSWNTAARLPVRTPAVPPVPSAPLAVSSDTHSPPKAMGPPIPRKRRLSASGDDAYPTNPTRQRLDNTADDGVSPSPVRRQVNTSTVSTSVGRFAPGNQTNNRGSNPESTSDMRLPTVRSESTTIGNQTNNRGSDSESTSAMRLPTVRSESTTIRPPRPNHLLPQSSQSSAPPRAAASVKPPVAARDDRSRVEGGAAAEDSRGVHCTSSSSAGQRQDSERVPLLRREVLEIRRQQVMLRDKEKVLLDEMNKLGGVPRPPSSATVVRTTSSAADTRLAKMEAELREERDRRIRAERALEEVERECKSPFVVPALFRAFMTISELSP